MTFEEALCAGERYAENLLISNKDVSSISLDHPGSPCQDEIIIAERIDRYSPFNLRNSMRWGVGIINIFLENRSVIRECDFQLHMTVHKCVTESITIDSKKVDRMLSILKTAEESKGVSAEENIEIDPNDPKLLLCAWQYHGHDHEYIYFSRADFFDKSVSVTGILYGTDDDDEIVIVSE